MCTNACDRRFDASRRKCATILTLLTTIHTMALTTLHEIHGSPLEIVR